MNTPVDSITPCLERCYPPTDIEAKVESVLKGLRIGYYSQYPTRTGFVLDFAVPSNRLAIEVDGPTHDTLKSHSRDAFRTLLLKREGWTVTRIHYSQIHRAKQIIKGALNVK